MPTDMSSRAALKVDYTVELKFSDGKVRVVLLEDQHGLKILGMRTYPRKKGLGRLALQFLQEKGLVGRPVRIMRNSEKFWIKMHAEGLVKSPRLGKSESAKPQRLSKDNRLENV